MRTGFGYDVHPFSPGDGFFLGGVKIPFDKGLAGYSDADVLLHAICDAVLGACALGDLGTHFPDTDPAYKGISSLELLKRVGELARRDGFVVVNIDSTVVVERPRISGFVREMIKNIAHCLSLDTRQVSIKATTSEGLGFVGQGQGIVAFALATVKGA